DRGLGCGEGEGDTGPVLARALLHLAQLGQAHLAGLAVEASVVERVPGGVRQLVAETERGVLRGTRLEIDAGDDGGRASGLDLRQLLLELGGLGVYVAHLDL